MICAHCVHLTQRIYDRRKEKQTLTHRRGPRQKPVTQPYLLSLLIRELSQAAITPATNPKKWLLQLI